MSGCLLQEACLAWAGSPRRKRLPSHTSPAPLSSVMLCTRLSLAIDLLGRVVPAGEVAWGWALAGRPQGMR